MKKILIITDSLTHTDKDDIFHLVEEFKNKMHDIYILDRAVKDNELFFKAKYQKNLLLHRVKENQFSFEYYQQFYNDTFSSNNLNYDLVLLRIDRPIKDEVLQSIDKIFNDAFIVNSPSGIIETASKEFLFEVKDVCPPMKLCKTYEDIINFSINFPIVLKPLKGYGGKGICRILNSKFYFENEEISKEKFKNKIIQILKKEEKILAVKYLKNIYKGDKRIYVVDGNIIGATNRVPSNNSWIGNVQYGAKVEKTTINNHEKDIIVYINNILKNKGIYVYGADILIDDDNNPILSEINTLNVGGCRSIDKLYNSGCIKKVVSTLLNLIDR